MDDKFTSLPKLFVHEMIKTDKPPYQCVGPLIKSQKWKKSNKNGTNIYCNRKRGKYFELCLFFKTMLCN